MNDLTEYTPQLPMSADQVVAQRDVIKTILSQVMIEEVHYGKVPGTQNKTLLKPGADMLASAFHISIEPELEDLSTYQEVCYRVRCKGVTMGSGQVIGIGVGICSSNEEKYKWRAAKGGEYDHAPNDQRRIKYATDWQNGRPCGTKEVKQVRTEPADVINTVLKMAKKRAQVDMITTALACGDMFDNPSMPKTRGPQNGQQRPPYQQGPAQTVPDFEQPTATGEINLGTIRTLMNKHGLRDVDLLAHLEVSSWGEVPAEKFNDAIKWIEENQP